MLRVTRADFWVGRMHARFLQPCRVLNKSRAYAHAYCLRACSRHEPKTLANIQNRRGKKHEETKSLDSRIWNLAMPAVASLLLDPILGVVDTAFVGRIDGNSAEAALGGLAISTTVFNFFFKIFNFLAVVTGPLVASQISTGDTFGERSIPYPQEVGPVIELKSEKVYGREAAAETVAGAMVLATVLGVFVLLSLEIGSDVILSWAGADVEDPVNTAKILTTVEGELLPQGLDVNSMIGNAEAYLRIRALSAPAVLICSVAVGAYRGLLNTRTPLLVSLSANMLNLVLDPILIFGVGALPPLGVAGAAAATTAAEWVSAVVFCFLLKEEGLLFADRVKLGSILIPDLSAERPYRPHSTSNFVSRSAPWLKPFAAGSISQLVRTLFLQIVLVSATAEAAKMGVAGSHQICIQVWWVTLFALDALAVAAQSLVAVTLGMEDVKAAREAANRTLQLAVIAGTSVGISILAAGPLLPSFFTTDTNVVDAVEYPMYLIAVLQPLNAAIFVGDGVFQGAADFGFLAFAMLFSAVPAVVSLGLEGFRSQHDLNTIWRSMALLQLGRAATLSARYWGPWGPVSRTREKNKSERTKEEIH